MADQAVPLSRTSALFGVDDRDRSVGLLFSTADVDLDHEVVDQKTWRLERFLKNPVVLWNHDPSKRPIGQVTKLALTEQGLAGRIKFATARANPEAEEIWQGVLEGNIRAASVRFVPSSRMPDERDGQLVNILQGNELLEVSLVAVGSNPVTVVPRDEGEARAAHLSAAGRALARGKTTVAKKADSEDETVLRLDAGRLGKAQRTPQGGIRVPARITRTGILKYRLPDGTVRRELRRPEEVFRPDSLATLKSAPVTDHHPPFGHVTPETWKAVTVGHVEVAKSDSDRYVQADLVIQDADQIAKIDSGDRQDISAGYRCVVRMTPGTWNGETYDAVQTSITYNHVALLPRGAGRAGTDVGLRLDSGDAVLCDDSFIEPPEQDQEASMKTIRIDGKDFDFGSEDHIAKLDELHKAEVTGLKTQVTTLTSERDKATARADAADKDATRLQGELAAAKDPQAIADKVNARVDLMVKAKGVLGESVKLDGKSDRDIMIDVVRADDANFDAQSRSDDYVTGRFESVLAKGIRADSVHAVVQHAERLRADAKDPAAKAAAEAAQKNRELWKQPLSVSKN